jgi:hypothetical protein
LKILTKKTLVDPNFTAQSNAQATSKKLVRLLNASAEIAQQSAHDSGAIFFLPRYSAMVSMPHSRPIENEFIVKNGALQLSMIAPSLSGLPYGSLPRLMLAFLTTQAVKKKSRHIAIDQNFSTFMGAFGIRATGGTTGSISGFKRQLASLLSTSFHTRWDGQIHTKLTNMPIADEAMLWWTSDSTNDVSKKQSHFVLGEKFFNDVRASAIPVDMRALLALKGSSLAIDIYVWLTHKMYGVNLNFGRPIPWTRLQEQFAPGFATDAKGNWNFKRNFIQQLKSVKLIYPAANVHCCTLGVTLKPSSTHIPKTYPQKSVDR